MTICFVKGFAEFGGILFDYASERNDINYAPHTLPFGVLQRESHGSGSEGFAAARWYGEREQSMWLCRLFYSMIENFTAQTVKGFRIFP